MTDITHILDAVDRMIEAAEKESAPVCVLRGSISNWRLLRAALSARSTGSGGVAAEPVAWAYEYRTYIGSWVPEVRLQKPSAKIGRRNIRPLYEHPPVAAAPTPPAEPVEGQELAHIRAMLSADQGDDDGPQILPDFDEDMSVAAMVSRCVHLLEQRRDALFAYKLKVAAAPTPPAGGGEAR